ncbi:MAG: gamma-aminobutyraldehyde dehydrogenase [Thermoanaerobaculia bacterium]
MKTYSMWIDGQAVGSASGEDEAILNPATEEVIARVPTGSSVDVDRAVAAAERAFETWYDSTPAERSLMLLKLADRIEAHSEELAQLEAANVGKPIALARSELPFLVDNLRFFAGACRCLEGKAAGEYLAGYTSVIRREPVGVVGLIAPWNYPLMMAIWKIGPSLAAGNTVVLKPAEQTPLTALRLAELAADIFPPGVFNVITGHGLPVGAPLVAHPKVGMVSLTGDVATGKEVARSAAATLKKVHLELGGKAPVLIFDDADLSAVVASVKLAGFVNSGQDCTAACRLYANERVYDALLEELVPAVSSLEMGPIESESTALGPVVSKEQRDRVSGFVERARATGHVRVLTGGGPAGGRGFYFQPTVVADARQEDEIVKKEVFGPVVTVTRFADDNEALRWANDVDYGLSASVWTTNVSRAFNAMRKLRFGTVWVNDHVPLVSEMPHGGYKQSGYGKDMSMYALEDYTQVKHCMVKM